MFGGLASLPRPPARVLALAAAALLATAGGARLAPGAAPGASMLVVVDIASQTLVAYRGGVPIAASEVSTGRPGFATPLGVFTILEKDVFHRSNQYSNAPMPYMQRLTWQGVALHAGVLPGYPASHGCIRLPEGFARRLFGETRPGMTVMVIDQHRWRRAGRTASESTAPAFWRPGLATRGPISIVVSGADRRMLVLRDGVTIGSAPVAFAGVIDRPQAYVRSVDGWQRVALPGDKATASTADAAPHAGSPGSDDPFGHALASAIGPGATMLVVPDSLARGIGAVPPPAEIAHDTVMADWHADAEVTGGR